MTKGYFTSRYTRDIDRDVQALEEVLTPYREQGELDREVAVELLERNLDTYSELSAIQLAVRLRGDEVPHEQMSDGQLVQELEQQEYMLQVVNYDLQQ